MAAETCPLHQQTRLGLWSSDFSEVLKPPIRNAAGVSWELEVPDMSLIFLLGDWNMTLMFIFPEIDYDKYQFPIIGDW